MPKINLTRKTSDEGSSRPKEDSSTLTRISLVSQTISQTAGDTSRKLSERLETPAARQRNLSRLQAETADKTFSLVNRQQQPNDSLPIRQNTCIVCLKVNKALFQQIFSSDGNSTAGKNNNSTYYHPGNSDFFQGPEESITNYSAELQMELSQDKTLDVPEIYGLTAFDIQPEKVNFKQYTDIDEECLNQKINSRSLSDKKIHLILASFKNKTWPNSSPYACWNCTEPFDNSPVGIPTIAMSDSYEDTYYLEGNFCSFNCAARYLFNTHSSADSQLFTIYEIMNFIYNEINDANEYEQIKLAPERICLKKFGGHLTIEEYRKNFMSKVIYEVFKSPLIPALYHIQENMDLTRLIRNQTKKKNHL